MAAKQCTKCGETKPASTEFFYKEPKGVLGLHSWCKECVKALARKNHFKSRDRNLARARTRRAARLDEYRQASKDYYRANREKALAEARKRSKAEGFRDRRREYENAWYHKNKDRALSYWHKRRAAKVAGGSHSKDEILALHAKQRGRCAACEVSLGRKFHRDHIIPLKRGGSNAIKNIQLLCPTCNSRKGAKLPEDFMREIGRLL